MEDCAFDDAEAVSEAAVQMGRTVYVAAMRMEPYYVIHKKLKNTIVRTQREQQRMGI